MTADITNAQAAWQITDRALRKVRAEHMRASTPKNWKALVAAANRREVAAASRSTAITGNGNARAQRAEFVTATTVSLPSGGAGQRRARQKSDK